MGVKPIIKIEDLKLSITSYNGLKEASKMVYFFNINLEYEDVQWIVKHRFSEFDQLHQTLKKYFVALPAMPPKTPFWQSLDDTFLQKRCSDLSQYMNDLLKIPYARNSYDFIRFLEILNHFEPDTSYVPRPIKKVIDSNYGINDFVYSPHEGLLLTACQDIKVSSRIDAKLSSLSLPWENESTTTIPLGSFNCWIYDKASKYWLPRSTSFFESQVTAIAFDNSKRYIYLGLESGRICVYFGNRSLSEFSLVKELDVHSGRVSSLYHDSKSGRLISIGRDSRLVVITCSSYEVASEVLMNEQWAMSMAFDPFHNIVFIGTSTNKILGYKISTSIPLKVLEIEGPKCSGHTGHVRALAYDAENQLLVSGSFDTTGKVWKLEFPQEDMEDILSNENKYENFSTNPSLDYVQATLMVTLQNGPPQKIKSISLMYNIQKVAIGYDDGCIGIWDIKTGDLIYILLGHTDSVTKLEWIPSVGMMISGARDKKVTFWILSGAKLAMKKSLSNESLESKTDEACKYPINNQLDSSHLDLSSTEEDSNQPVQQTQDENLIDSATNKLESINPENQTDENNIENTQATDD